MKNILIVDDDNEICLVIKSILQNKEYSIISTNNPTQVLEMLAQESFDLVVTDIIMPQLNGLDLMIKIKENFPEVKVLAMTAGGETAGIVKEIILGQATTLGANEIIGKPFDENKLLHTLRTLFKK